MITRRRLMRWGAGLTGTAFTSGLLPRLIAEARGQANPDRLRFVLFTDGNGWSHQSSSRNAPTLDTSVRSESDWDLPEVLRAFSPFAERVSINRELYQPHGNNLHGSGWGTTTGVPPVEAGPGGISIDRLIGLNTGTQDVFPSIAFGVGAGRDRAPVCLSADGYNRPFPALGSAVEGHAFLFGAGAEGTTFDGELALLDGVMDDVNRERNRLVGPERIKMDQLLFSYESLANELRRKREIFDEREPPSAPDPSLNGGLNRAKVEGMVDLIANAFAFGLTHVAHLSIYGRDAHNAGWGFLGNEHSGDAHEQVAHVSGGFNGTRSEATYRAQINFKAEMLARLYSKLDAIPVGDSTMAKQTVFAWVNSGGGKHHNGGRHSPIVTIGDGDGALQMGKYVEHGSGRSMNQAYYAISQALGVSGEGFGDPEHGGSVLSSLAA